MLLPYISVRAANFDLQPATTLTVEQALGQHDLATFTSLQSGTTTLPQFATGEPYAVSWGYRPDDIETFVGYCSQAQPYFASGDGETPGRDGVEYKITCLAASMIFKSTLTDLYENVPHAAVVRRLARMFNFSVETDQGPDRPSVMIGSDTLWGYMVSAAQEDGVFLDCVRTHLRYQSFRTRLDMRGPVMMFSKRDYTLREFVPISSTNQTMGTQHDRSVDGIDPYRGTVIQYTSPSRFKSLVTPSRLRDVTRSWQGMTSIAETGHELTQFARRARAVLSGVAAVRPGSIINIEVDDTENSGYWFVESVAHNVNPEVYTMRVELLSDRTGRGHAASLTDNVITRPNGTTDRTGIPVSVQNSNVWRAGRSRRVGA